MSFRRRQLLGWGILAVAALSGLLWLTRLDYAKKISVDVLDLIPTDERMPELALMRQLASQAEARTMFFVLTADGGKPAPAESAARFASELTRSATFDQAVPMADSAARDALGAELFAQRFALLFPQWLRERETAFTATGGAPAGFPAWLAETTATRLGVFLGTPEALAFQDLIPADPLLLIPDAVERLKGGLALVQPAAAATTSEKPTLVWARLAASPFSEEGQGPVFASIERATAAVRAEVPGFATAYAGVNRFAAASRARIEQEIKWLNTASLIAVLAVALLFIRSVHRGLHLVPVVLLSMLGAWVCTTAVFDRVHVLVFVVGSLLTGVAIDYGFYLFMQAPLRANEDYWDKVRRLAKPLIASCLTTVAGFALLLFSELPLIRQLGIFVGAGLICALLAAVVYFSTVRNPFLPARVFRGGQALPAATRRRFRRAVLILWIASLPGLALLTWKDDIRDLEIPSPELKREDARIRALFGDGTDRTVYLTHGPTLGAAREAVEKLHAWLAATSGGRTETIGLSAVVPTEAAATRALRFVREQPEFPSRLRAALEKAGYEADGFEPFFTDYARQAADAEASPAPARLAMAVRALQAKLTGPLGLLVHDGQPLSWFVTLASDAPAAAPPKDTQTVSASQLEALNLVFSRYRQSALWLSLTGLLIVGGGVLLTYGLRDGVRIFAIPCGACLGVFGALGWLGSPLNLFHLFGAFLGVCLTHNYSIFTATSAYLQEPTPVSVRMSALTTAASFGVLALSGIPVVRALGATVSAMVIVSLLMIEFEHLARLGKKA